MVQEVYTNGDYKIVVEDKLRIDFINDKFLKHYYAWVTLHSWPVWAKIVYDAK